VVAGGILEPTVGRGWVNQWNLADRAALKVASLPAEVSDRANLSLLCWSTCSFHVVYLELPSIAAHQHRFSSLLPPAQDSCEQKSAVSAHVPPPPPPARHWTPPGAVHVSRRARADPFGGRGGGDGDLPQPGRAREEDSRARCPAVGLRAGRLRQGHRPRGGEHCG